jgi:hypothetical protein
MFLYAVKSTRRKDGRQSYRLLYSSSRGRPVAGPELVCSLDQAADELPAFITAGRAALSPSLLEDKNVD